jgi:release factor glutamine methyltransferase
VNAPGRSGDVCAADAPTSTIASLRDATVRLASVSDTPRLDAEVLLAFAVGRPRSALHAAPERALTDGERRSFDALLERRLGGEPLAYLTGEREFFSLSLRVSPAVLVPRPETELLVETALARSAALPRRPRILDLGTGSGAIALALKTSLPDADVTAADADAAALDVARANAGRLGLAVRFVASHWFEALRGERFDLIASNPPYVPSADVRGALTREPRLALDGGADGLDAYRALLAAAPAHLARGGALALEHGYAQRDALLALARASGWRAAAVHDDLAGRPRVVELERTSGA